LIQSGCQNFKNRFGILRSGFFYEKRYPFNPKNSSSNPQSIKKAALDFSRAAFFNLLAIKPFNNLIIQYQ